MGPEQFLAGEIIDKPMYTGFLENLRVNAFNTIMQQPHYFTYALLRIHTEGVLK